MSKFAFVPYAVLYVLIQIVKNKRFIKEHGCKKKIPICRNSIESKTKSLYALITTFIKYCTTRTIVILNGKYGRTYLIGLQIVTAVLK